MTRCKAIALIGALFALSMASPASATKYAAEFLKIQVGARAMGMGGAFVAVADDATSIYWNPAGMVYLPYHEILPQHSEKFGGLVNHDYLGAVLPLGGKAHKQGALGIGLIRSAVDDIAITPRPGALVPVRDFDDYGIDGDPTTPDFGQGDGKWEPGEPLHIPSSEIFMASSADIALFTSYARQHGPHWAFGGSLKFVRQSIPDTIQGQHVTSFGAGLDAGLLYMPTDAVTIGVAAHDLTQTYLAWSNGVHETVSPTIDTGVAINFYPAPRHALTYALDLGWGFEGLPDSQFSFGNETVDLRTGLEYWYASTLALRTGVNGKDLAFGAGVRYKQIGIDYCAQLHRFLAQDDKNFPNDTNLDLTHLVSASFSW